MPTTRVLAGATLFILISSLVRLYFPLLGDERFGKDAILALITAGVSGFYVFQGIVAFCKRAITSRWPHGASRDP